MYYVRAKNKFTGKMEIVDGPMTREKADKWQPSEFIKNAGYTGFKKVGKEE